MGDRVGIAGVHRVLQITLGLLDGVLGRHALGVARPGAGGLERGLRRVDRRLGPVDGVVGGVQLGLDHGIDSRWLVPDALEERGDRVAGGCRVLVVDVARVEAEPRQRQLELLDVWSAKPWPQRAVHRQLPDQCDKWPADDLQHRGALVDLRADLGHLARHDRGCLEPADLRDDLDRARRGHVATRHHLAVQRAQLDRDGHLGCLRRGGPGQRFSR